jgi:hypothetical protein
MRWGSGKRAEKETYAIAAFDEHLGLFHCPLFAGLFLGRCRAAETTELAATLVRWRGQGQACVIPKLESGDLALGSGSRERDATLFRTGGRGEGCGEGEGGSVCADGCGHC